MDEPDEETRARFAEHDRESAERAERWILDLDLTGAEAESFRNHGKHWILIDDEAVAVGLLEWAQWFNKAEQRIIARDEVQSPGGRIFTVSTVFLGLDHSFGMSGPPLIFETMIFDWDMHKSKRWDAYCRRYSTTAHARLGHALAMEAVAAGEDARD